MNRVPILVLGRRALPDVAACPWLVIELKGRAWALVAEYPTETDARFELERGRRTRSIIKARDAELVRGTLADTEERTP